MGTCKPRSWGAHHKDARDKKIQELELQLSYQKQRNGALKEALRSAKYRLDMCAKYEKTAKAAFDMFNKAVGISNEAVTANGIVTTALQADCDIAKGVLFERCEASGYNPYRLD